MLVVLLYADLVTTMSIFCVLSVGIVCCISPCHYQKQILSKRVSPMTLHLPYLYFPIVASQPSLMDRTFAFQSPFNISMSFLGISWMHSCGCIYMYLNYGSVVWRFLQIRGRSQVFSPTGTLLLFCSTKNQTPWLCSCPLLTKWILLRSVHLIPSIWSLLD